MGDKKRAEDFARYKQYDYQANSNLVLTAEQRRRGGKEPDGSAQSLWENMAGRMGDRVQRDRPEGIDDKKKKKRDNLDSEGFAIPKKRRAGGGFSVLEIDTAGFYRPKTKETREAYEALLSVIGSHFSDTPQDVLRGAADEVLATLKNDHMKDPDRHKEINSLLGTLPNEKFAQLVALGKLITDFVPEGEAAAAGAADGEGALDEELGVAVEFEDESEEDEEEGMVDVLEDDEDGGDLEEGGPGGPGAVRTGTTDAEEAGNGTAGGGAGTEDGMIPVQEIDAYWLQRRITKAFGAIDPAQAQSLAEDTLAALRLRDLREAENKLVMLLDFDRFDLIKELIKNRVRLVYCMRLARAQNDEERGEIEEEMSESGGEARGILDALHATRASARDRQSAMERNIREEARKLRQGGENGVATGDGFTNATAAGAAANRRMIDLDALTFAQGAHFNSNKTTTLPQGSYRTVHKGYEEVHVPAVKPQPFGKNEKLREISELPDWAQLGFKGMTSLNRIQSRVCETALFSSENMLVCAPTGAGKTNVAMLTMLHEIGMHKRKDGSIDISAFKMIYVAPMKALVAEMVGNFSKRLESYGVKVKELTGDISLSRAEIEDTQLIVVTPEKWDIITRKSSDRAYTQLVRLVIIDEIHLLHDERGSVLESLVARTLRHVESTQEMVRLVGLSATLPNFEDVAAFLRVKADKGLFYFDNSFRPCPLAQQYIGVSVKKPLQRFQLMNEICYTKVMEAAGKHQVLVFVHSRKETTKTAKFIKEEAMKNDALSKILRDDSASREILQTEAEAVKSADLRDLLPFGIGIHHAGMARVDRTLVEDLFADGHIQVLVSTATLAWGVNLPAHTVIIKGTQIYNPVKAAWMELSPLDVMQMFGRAGRPQFDTFGEGIIITANAQLQFYLSLFNMQLPVESQFVGKLEDNLNAEIVLGSVQSVQDAAAWLGYTYLYVRMMQAPQVYGVPLDAIDSDPLMHERRLDLVHTAAAKLDRHNLVKYDRRSGSLQSTDLGRIASHYYVSYQTISAFNDHLRPTMGDIELLRLFTQADEFKYMVVREEEKMELAKLIERVPIPIKESLEEPAAKINVLLQAYISKLTLEGLALAADMVYITQSAGRLMRCLYEVCLRRGWAGLADRALTLAKCVARRMWASQTPLRQFKGVHPEILIKVERKELPWERWYDLSSQDIGELIRFPKMGKALHKLIHQFPRLELAAHVQPITRSLIKVDLTITPDFQWDEKIHSFAEPFIIIVEDADSENILHHEGFVLGAARAEEDSLVSFTLPISEPLPPQYFIRVVSDKWLGCESTLPVSFRHLILPEKYPPPTELHDLQPLPISALRNPEFEALFPKIDTFNPVQTQAFTALFNTDENVLLGAPAGSGKTAAAEFAILRMVQKAAEAKGTACCVYVAPLESVVNERYEDWAQRFGKGLGLTVVKLTGEAQGDVKLLEKANIAIATPQHWDGLSRRWRQRKAVQGVSLFIADELHLIGGRHGPVLEVVCSRMRYMASQLDVPIRIVGLSASLANARDVADWLGVTSHGLFNFPPIVRPVPLEVHVQGFEVANLEARMAAMARPAYHAVCRHARDGSPAIVFVPTRRHARMAALDLLTHAAADGLPHRFRQASEEDLAPFLDRVKDSALRHALSYGVGYLHEAQSPEESSLVKALFSTGAVQVLVATGPCAWGLSCAARAVVVMGTQYYDITGQGTNDYSVTDLLQMVGRAGRPGTDTAATCVLMCHAPRKEYYKKFLFEPLPVESHLDAALHDAMAAEIVTRTVQNKQDAVDYLTWTFYYRRLTQNPNYYNMTGVSHRHVSDHLSELVESVLADLETSKVISIEEDFDLEPLNLGMIAAYYYVSYTTIELFAASLAAKTKLKGLVEILSAASEYDEIPVRPGEERTVEKTLAHAPLALEKPRYTDPHTKVNALIQAHLSRSGLNPDLSSDAKLIIAAAPRLLQAMVDVVSSSGWLNPALATMELSQMITQGLWQRDPVLMQIPGVVREVAAAATASGVETIFDVAEMEEDARRETLQLDGPQLEVANAWLARYPDIGVNYEILDAENIVAGEAVTVSVSLEREGEGEVRPVDAPRFPGRKDENWWLVVGDPASNSLLAIKRIALQRKAKAKLEFAAPASAGKKELTLFLMCDSYMGCDQEFELELNVAPGEEEEAAGVAEGDDAEAMDE